jgi:hypothetical protein
MELLNPLSDAAFAGKTATYTNTAGSTGTWPAGADAVFVWATSNAYIDVGEGVTATSSGTPIPAGVPVPFKVPQGSGAPWRVSALQIGVAGSVYAKPINSR